jgi:hypothetical protein
MASCLKCGRAKLPRDKFGKYKCRRCGVAPSGKWLDQGGEPQTRPGIVCEPICGDLDTVPAFISARTPRLKVTASFIDGKNKNGEAS